MDLNEIRHGPYPVFVVAGDVDLHDALPLRDALGRAVEAGRCRILLEFARGGFVSAAAIGYLLRLQALARSRGGEILLVREPALLRRCLGLLGAGGRFRSAGTREQAAALFCADAVTRSPAPFLPSLRPLPDAR